MAGQTLDPESAVPLYQQLADLLRADIESGRIQPDRPLPSELTLQQEHGVSRVTVRHSFQLLREAGLVVTVRGKGTYVATR
ncbi:GntR family transcriptional regulator [Krasilnikovia sp. MM14-A1259]|uniref:GntR family transcriptional regulator n=1 Tax=Krasilnikovia sp. MM14-A1259 TaxID=3373539 RepID=UPI0038309DFF